jgi:adenylate cyclase
MKAIGLGPWTKNAKYCTGCFRELRRSHGGAEVECSLLFADVRGSTQLAERIGAREFNRLMGRFYDTATDVLVRYDAIVDKFVGDEVIAIFIPVLTDGAHARKALDAGLELLRAASRKADRPWGAIGIGLNTGVAYVGAVGTADHVEFTALGDPVNVAARLASVAGPGELLVAESTARAAALDSNGAERRHLELRGKSEATDVVVLRP